MISAWTYTISLNAGSWNVNRSKRTVMPSGQPGLMGLPLHPPDTVGLLAGGMLSYAKMTAGSRRNLPPLYLGFPQGLTLPHRVSGGPAVGGGTAGPTRFTLA